MTDIKFDIMGTLFAVASSDGHIEVHDFDTFLVDSSMMPSPSDRQDQRSPPSDGERDSTMASYQPNNIQDALSNTAIRVLCDSTGQLPFLSPPLVQLKWYVLSAVRSELNYPKRTNAYLLAVEPI